MDKIKDYWFLINGILIPFVIYIYKINKAQSHAIKNMIKSQLLNQYYDYKEIGKMPRYIKECWYDMYENYVALGGNSFIKEDIKNKVDVLDTCE